MKAATVAAFLLGAIVAFSATSQAVALTDLDVANFALNLEYLEAEFYSWAVNGHGLPAELRLGGPPSVGGQKANLHTYTKEIATEIATDEEKHVKLLQLLLGKAAVPQPLINIGSAFSDAADAALKTKLSPRFTPYLDQGDDLIFLHGAFIFEDVGVTAYAGAANLLKSKNILQYAARILAVEAYHAGTVRTLLQRKADTIIAPYGAKVSTIVGAISGLRAAAGGGKDQGIIRNGKANIVPTNGNGLAYGRSATEVLSIVTLGAKNGKGGFFPNGLNGNIK